MGILLLLVGLVILASGALKLRRRELLRTKHQRLYLGEIVAGVVLIIGSGIGLSQLRPLAWILIFSTLILSAVSSSLYTRRILQRIRDREASENIRLKEFIESPPTDSP